MNESFALLNEVASQLSDWEYDDMWAFDRRLDEVCLERHGMTYREFKIQEAQELCARTGHQEGEAFTPKRKTFIVPLPKLSYISQGVKNLTDWFKQKSNVVEL